MKQKKDWLAEEEYNVGNDEVFVNHKYMVNEHMCREDLSQL